MKLSDIKREITSHPPNQRAKKLGYEPVYGASRSSKIVIIGQAPGKRARRKAKK